MMSICCKETLERPAGDTAGIEKEAFPFLFPSALRFLHIPQQVESRVIYLSAEKVRIGFESCLRLTRRRIDTFPSACHLVNHPRPAEVQDLLIHTSFSTRPFTSA